MTVIFIAFLSSFLTFVFLVLGHDWKRASAVIEESRRPETHLNYYRIAELERDIWGQTFHMALNDGVCACDTCTNRQAIYTNKDLVRPPKPASTVNPMQDYVYKPPTDASGYPLAEYGYGWQDDSGRPW